MDGDHDDVVLSDSELEQLAAIQQTLTRSDPALVERLGRHGQVPSRARLLTATLLVALGSVVVVITFASWLWLGVAGMALMTGGAVLGAGPLALLVMAGIGRCSRFPGGSSGAGGHT